MRCVFDPRVASGSRKFLRFRQPCWPCERTQRYPLRAARADGAGSIRESLAGSRCAGRRCPPRARPQPCPAWHARGRSQCNEHQRRRRPCGGRPCAPAQNPRRCGPSARACNPSEPWGCGLSAMRAHGKALAALGATARQDQSALRGGHAGAESVGPLPLDFARLVGALHGSGLKSLRKQGHAHTGKGAQD